MRRVTRTERLFFWPRCFCHGRRTLTDCWLPVASGFYTSTWRVLVARGHSQSENSPPTNQLWISSHLLGLYFWMECAHLPLPLGHSSTFTSPHTLLSITSWGTKRVSSELKCSLGDQEVSCSSYPTQPLEVPRIVPGSVMQALWKTLSCFELFP